MPPATLKLSTLHFRPYPSLTHSLPPHSQKGRIIIITGGARGIGLSIAHAFASTDILALHLLGRDSSTLLSAKPDIGARYPDCEIYTHVTDIADEADVNGAFERIGRLYDGETMVRGYVLVHAAAFLPVPENMDQTSQQGGQEWWQTFETNVKGTFHLLRAVSNLVHTLPPPPPGARQDDDLPPQQATTDGATIINLVSASAYAFTAPGISAYSASKLAAIRMAECVAYEGMAASARIVNLHPGAVETDMWRKSGGEAVGIPCNDETLVPQFTLWLTTPAAQFLHGRTVEANWDIDELLAQKDVIVNENLLTTTLRGYPFDTAEAWDKVVKDSLRKEAGTV